MAVGFGFFTWSLLASHPWVASIPGGLGLVGVYLLLSTYRSRVTLYPDRIEVEELTRTEVLSREEIRGWRTTPTSPPTFAFIPKDPDRRTVKFAQVFRVDPDLAEWIYSLPSLDVDDHKRAKAEIRNDRRLGATPGERVKALGKGKRIARVANAVGMLISLWAFLRPTPYELAVGAVALLPWIAVALLRWSHGLLRLDGPPNDVRPNVATMAMLSPLILLLRSVFDYQLVHNATLGVASVGCGALLWWAFYSADEALRRRCGSAIAVFVFSLVYGYGAAIQANALFDRSPETSFSTPVVGKRISSGKTTTYYVEVGPWGPIAKPNRVRVAKETYDHIQAGDTVHFVLHKGALGATWYYMRSWERGRASAASPTRNLRHTVASNLLTRIVRL